MLEQFIEHAIQRTGSRTRMGFDWVTIIMPIVMSLIQSCLENRSKLAGFVEGRRGMLQIASLKMNCRRAARQAGVGPFRAIAVGDEIAAAILAECDAVSRDGLMVNDGTDIYQAVLDEINAVS
jgi:hypothetical protein